MKYIYSIYTWIVAVTYFFILTLISILVLQFISAKKYSPFFRASLKIMFAILFVRVERDFEEEIDVSKNYIYMSNHVSLFDAPLFSAYMPEFVTALEAIEHFSWPVYKHLARLHGNIPINRTSIRDSLQSMNKAMEVLQNNNSMVIFPEGSRTIDGTIGEFKRMSFKLAQKANVGIVPIGMSGAYTLNPKGKFILRPSKIRLKFGKVISAEQIQTMQLDELVDMVHSKVIELHEYD